MELVDRWYVRLVSLAFAPLYAVLKMYDLMRFIKNTFFTALEGLISFVVYVVSREVDHKLVKSLY